ncbi:MAG: hypothetical protein NC832_01455 [Candidatus Omnitrophica bacterium]|nr:hypothetical protein [Candidatus Omnitrophota bacterium]
MRKEIVILGIIGVTFSLLYGAQQDYSVILKRNIFTEPEPKPQPVIEKTPIIKPAPPPSLNSLIDLAGVIYFSEGDSFVIVKSKKTREEIVLHQGDIIENARVVKIEENGVVFFYEGKEERFSLKQEDREGMVMSLPSGLAVKLDEKSDIGIKKENESEAQIVNPLSSAVPEFTEPVFVDLNKILTEAKNDTELFRKVNVTPKLSGGKIDGFEINNLPQNSLPYKYGLRDGDIVRRVNGIFIDSIAKGFSVANQIIKERTEIVTVEIIRNNNPLVLTFKLK